MKFNAKSAFKHVWSGKSNTAVNAFSTNVDVNRHIGSRIFSDSAFGGQKEMEGVLHAMDKRANPWKHDAGRSAEVQKIQGRIDKVEEKLKNPNLTENQKTNLKDALSTYRSDIMKAKAPVDGDPGFWNTAGSVAKGTFHAMNAGSAGQVAAKWGTVAAGYMAINGIGRGLSGGGLTYNNTGQRDIMGVPFV